MKKTLTVNLGGTVFNIDDDAYRLLDNYLSNLKMHFRKEAGADEIVDDIERRISELFAEKLSAGSQVITIADVEEVIARMGKPEDMEAEGESASADSGSTSAGGGYGAGAWNSNTAYGTTRRRLYRNPDDKMLGGVISGMAAYLGWDVTLLRLLLLVILICGVGTLIPVFQLFGRHCFCNICIQFFLQLFGSFVCLLQYGISVPYRRLHPLPDGIRHSLGFRD